MLNATVGQVGVEGKKPMQTRFTRREHEHISHMCSDANLIQRIWTCGEVHLQWHGALVRSMDCKLLNEWRRSRRG
jgi:hypothetical protein